MGLIWGKARAVASTGHSSGQGWVATFWLQPYIPARIKRLSQGEWVVFAGKISVLNQLYRQANCLMKNYTLPFPVWTQSGWGSLCARYRRLEQGWRGSQGRDLSDICIPPHDCSSAPIRLWFQIHQNKTLSISRLLVTLPRIAQESWTPVNGYIHNDTSSLEYSYFERGCRKRCARDNSER